eukprot:gene37640-45726_t
MSQHIGPPEVYATVVQDPLKRIQIPANLRPGDSFIYQDPELGPVTIVVPQSAVPGGFINVIMPAKVEEDVDASQCERPVVMDRATIGATIAGGLLGVILAGSVGCFVCAGGAAYLATAKKDTSMGSAVRRVGDSTVKSALSAKKWVSEQLKDRSSNNRSASQQTHYIPVNGHSK